MQIVLSSDASSQDYASVNSLVGRFSNVELRQTGQGLKIGKYPIHFHLVGDVSASYVRNCSIHRANNRAIAVHGVTRLRVEWNVVFDVRGHAIFIEVLRGAGLALFSLSLALSLSGMKLRSPLSAPSLEDGTETRNTIAHNLVAVVRPIWSLLAVDQSPAAFWIVNPDNDVYGNVAAGSSHYGFW